MPDTIRNGITIPFDAVPLGEHGRLARLLADLGYTDVWTSEVGGYDAFTPLVLAGTATPALRLGTAIVPVFTRGPATLAQSAASLCALAPGRVALGIGTSSDVIVDRWNGLAFERPYQRVRDSIRFLRAALAGEKVDEEYETFRVQGFRLEVPVEQPPPILVAALRPAMLRLAGREADGAILNWLSADDVRRVAPIVGPGKEIVARVFVIPTGEGDEAREAARVAARRQIAAYLNVPVYAAFHAWLGRGDALRPMWDAWAAGDRRAATAAIPEQLVEELVVIGPVEECRAHIERYRDAGVATTAPKLLGVAPEHLEDVLRGLAP